MASPTVLTTLLALCQVFAAVLGDAGILSARIADQAVKPDWKNHYCISFNPHFHDLPKTQDKAVRQPLLDLSEKLGCNDDDYRNKSVFVRDNKVVLVTRGNCTFTRKASLAEKYGFQGILISSNEWILPAAENDTDYNEINITVATILNSDAKSLLELGADLEVLLYVPVRNFDPSMIVMYLLAVTCIVLGGFWSGITRHASAQKRKYQKAKKKNRNRNAAKSTSTGESGSGSGEEEEDEEEGGKKEEEGMDISIPAICIFFLLVCTFLVLLYFFYDYLVYGVIAMFVIAGSTGIFSFFLPVWKKIIPCSKRLPANRVPCFSGRPELRSLLLLALAFGVGITWAVERHASYAWVLQDVMGFCFCVNVLKTVYLPNLKICTVLLSLLFVYDIFFVFITPLFTKSGDSVMVSVATGNNSQSGEQLPMVFKVPSLTREPIAACSLPDALLGFGDIIVPGLLVAHNHAFDLTVQSRRVYFIASAIGYAVGLVITYIALALMKSGQPALLYLVPCTLVTTFVIGCIRGEVRKLWSGVKSSHKKDDSPTADVQDQNNHASLQDTASVNSVVTVSSSETDNENKELIRK